MSGNNPHPYHPYHQLYGCQLKLHRAQEHFDALQDSMREFLGRNPYELVNKFESDSCQNVMSINIRKQPPPAWSPAIGDIVYGMRSALDHLAWQLVIRNGRKPSTGNLFPIFTKDPLDPNAHASEGEFKTARKRWKDQVRGMHPDDVALLKELQPYKGTDDPSLYPLARLNQLSNWDKHREFHFAAQAYMGSKLTVKDAINIVGQKIYTIPIGQIFEDGTEIARVETFGIGPKAEMNMHMEIFLEIAFGKGSPLEGFGVKQTLSALGLHVHDVILEFKARFDQDNLDSSTVKG